MSERMMSLEQHDVAAAQPKRAIWAWAGERPFDASEEDVFELALVHFTMADAVPLVSVVSTATFAPSGPPSSMPAAGTPVQTASQALKNAIATLQQQRART